MAWTWDNIDWSATAAWAQAALSAGAVFIAAQLQDRALEKRETAQRNDRLEAVASAARWVLVSFDELLGRLGNHMDPNHFNEAVRIQEFDVMTRVLRSTAILELADDHLTAAMLELEVSVVPIHALLEEKRAWGMRTQLAIGNLDFIRNRRVEVFNAAASVERRVAKLIGRPPLI